MTFHHCHGFYRESPLNANEIAALAKATLNGSMPFPEFVGKLLANGVEYYHVDYALGSFYGAMGAVVTEPLLFEDLSPISEHFDAAALNAAILDSQQHGETFRAFCERAVKAGSQGYFAFLRGKRVTYLSRQGDQHTEWFPAAQPREMPQ